MALRNPKRLVYLLHRWSGVLMAVPMALWFLSGMVMLFVGYPKLYPWQHLARLEALGPDNCCLPLDTLLAAQPGDVGEITGLRLISVAGRPQYQITRGSSIQALDAQTASPIDGTDPTLALASVVQYLPGSTPTHEGLLQADLWTRSAALNPHRPLHKIAVHDAAGTIVYVSSRTGEVLQKTDAWNRGWNYVGAWLHWLYVFRGPSPDPVWHWLIVILSAAATFSTLAGVLVGIWRWRFARPYRSGSRSPYPRGALRWHHLSGLIFCVTAVTWIFSGLMSMNPLDILSARDRPDRTAYQGRTLSQAGFAREATDLIQAQPAGSVKEVRWSVIGAHPYLIGRSADGQPVALSARASRVGPQPEIDQLRLLAAARQLYPAPVRSMQRLQVHDAYYYPRAPQAMRGAREKPLPVWRIEFDDPGNTWVHIDPRTGDIESTMDRRQRLGRWLFELLHSWDLPVMLAAPGWREAILILFSLGGLALSATGIRIGYRRLRTTLTPAAPGGGK